MKAKETLPFDPTVRISRIKFLKIDLILVYEIVAMGFTEDLIDVLSKTCSRGMCSYVNINNDWYLIAMELIVERKHEIVIAPYE